MARNTRTPIPDLPPRRAGQALEEHVYGRVLPAWAVLIGAAVGAITIAIVEWLSRWTGLGFGSWTATVAAALYSAMAVYSVVRSWGPARRAVLGARGEQAVGQVLDELRDRGYRVFHDLPINGIAAPDAPAVPAPNIDHVLVGPAGVFALETKTRRKPLGRRAEVRYVGERLLIDGFAPDRDPIAQAQACASAVRAMLRRGLDRDVPVRPVVLFPGWGVNERSGAEVWVLNPKRLFSWLEAEERRAAKTGRALAPEEIALVARTLDLTNRVGMN